MFIPDPGSEFFPSRIQGQRDPRIPDPGSASNSSSILTQKIVKGTGSRIRILNTAFSVSLKAPNVLGI
jgi:hypothetical protein